MWGGLVLLVADDSRTGYSCLGPVCDALGTGGKEDVMGCSGCFLSEGQVHSEHNLTDTRESGKAGVCTLRFCLPKNPGGTLDISGVSSSPVCSLLGKAGPIIGYEICHSGVHLVNTSDPTSSATFCHYKRLSSQQIIM